MDNIFVGHQTLATDNDIKSLLEVLIKDEKIIDVPRFTTVFDSLDTVEPFVEQWKLSGVQAELLRFAVESTSGALESAISWSFWNLSS